MARTAAASAAKKPASTVAHKGSPFSQVTLSKLPEILDGRSRTNFGWEDLKKPKQAKVIPAEKIEAARTSISNYAKTHMNEDGSGPRFTVTPQTDAEGAVIPLTVETNGEQVVVRDNRGNVKPAFYLVVRVTDYAAGENPKFVAK